MKIKFGIAGTHSTGKTTLLDFVASRLGQDGYRVARVADLATEAHAHGFPILRGHTFESTLWIITRGISLELEAELKADVVLVDRPVADALGYLRAALGYRGESLPEQDTQYLGDLVRVHSSRYSRLFKTQIDPSLGIAEDKVRDSDLSFRELAAKGIDGVFSDLSIPFSSVPIDPVEAQEVVLEAIRLALEGGTAKPVRILSASRFWVEAELPKG